VGLWYRDLACVVAGAPELAHHTDRADELAQDADGRALDELHEAMELVDDFRARLALNVSYDLACEALAFRLERVLR
jgi:DNA polymerase-3 subunit delta'